MVITADLTVDEGMFVLDAIQRRITAVADGPMPPPDTFEGEAVLAQLTILGRAERKVRDALYPEASPIPLFDESLDFPVDASWTEPELREAWGR